MGVAGFRVDAAKHGFNDPACAQVSPAASGLMASDKAVVFPQNHDTQHNGGIGPADGNVYRLAYTGCSRSRTHPSVRSSYAFS